MQLPWLAGRAAAHFLGDARTPTGFKPRIHRPINRNGTRPAVLQGVAKKAWSEQEEPRFPIRAGGPRGTDDPGYSDASQRVQT